MAIAAILAVCLGAPIAEMCDQWDHTFQDGNDTETNLVVVALCVGVALLVARLVFARVGARSLNVEDHIFGGISRRVTVPLFAAPIPAISPPIPLRV